MKAPGPRLVAVLYSLPAMAPKISAPPNQRFECRDCPARCCRLPASIRISAEEARRYLAEPWVRERVGAEGVRIIEGGGLPVREEDRGPRCVFLDDDLLCSMQKRFGHDYIPRTCQAFPFAFARDERGVIVAQLSQLCPSIRDNYGRPIERQLRAKLLQKGTTERMSTEMYTLSGIVLSQTQYLRVARRWEEELASAGSPATTLARLYDLTLAFEGALPAGPERVTDAAVDEALGRADGHGPAPLAPRKSPSLHARVLFAYLLGHLCYPSRIKLAHRIGDAPGARLSGWRSLGNKIAWMLGRGTVDMQFIPRPFNLRRVKAVDRFLSESEGGAREGVSPSRPPAQAALLSTPAPARRRARPRRGDHPHLPLRPVPGSRGRQDPRDAGRRARRHQRRRAPAREPCRSLGARPAHDEPALAPAHEPREVPGSPGDRGLTAFAARALVAARRPVVHGPPWPRSR